MRWLKYLLIFILTKIVIILVLLFFFAQKEVPEKITYGLSFNTLYARELGLDWKQTYDAVIDDLKVRHLRLAAHWPMIEPENNQYNFTELDYQVMRAEEVGADVVLAVGRRLPRWPECHLPTWTNVLEKNERDTEQFEYMKTVIDRYKNSPAVKIWQVENEPFLEVFAFDHCGELDTELLDQEISLVRELDPNRQILVTDSGNLGLWYKAYKRGDLFGTSVYVHFWNPELGQFRTLLPPFIYRVKENIIALFYGKKPTVLIELSAEPWLIAPVTEVPLEVQFSRMNEEKFSDIIEYARHTRYDRQYLWGAEWWYWLKLNGHNEMWSLGQSLFVEDEIKDN